MIPRQFKDSALFQEGGIGEDGPFVLVNKAQVETEPFSLIFRTESRQELCQTQPDELSERRSSKLSAGQGSFTNFRKQSDVERRLSNVGESEEFRLKRTTILTGNF